MITWKAILSLLFTLVVLAPPGPPPEVIPNYGYYYYDQDQGEFRTTTHGTLYIENLRLVTHNDPQYGDIWAADLHNGFGFDLGDIAWNLGGLRDRANVTVGTVGQELEVMRLPHGSPLRGIVFIDPLP